MPRPIPHVDASGNRQNLLNHSRRLDVKTAKLTAPGTNTSSVDHLRRIMSDNGLTMKNSSTREIAGLVAVCATCMNWLEYFGRVGLYRTEGKL